MAANKSNPKTIIGVVVALIIIALVAWQFKKRDQKEVIAGASPKTDSSELKQGENKPLVFLVGYLSDRQLEKFKQDEETSKSFLRSKGLVVDLKYSDPDPARALIVKPDWDFTLSSSASTLTQYFNGTKMRPILWNKGCNMNIQIMANKDANIYNANDLAGKKVLFFNFGFYAPTELDAIAKWNLSKTDLYFTNDLSKAFPALKNKQVDAVVSHVLYSPEDSQKISLVYGKLPVANLKEVSVLDYGIPCRVINASNSTDPEKVKLFIDTVKENIGKKEGEDPLFPDFLRGFEPVAPGEFEAIAKKFDMKKLEKLKNNLKDFNSIPPTEIAAPESPNK